MDGVLLAAWAQAVANTVVLFLIYKQIKQANTQMVQNDEQERWRRSFEFIKFYREELRTEDAALGDHKDEFQALSEKPSSEPYRLHMKYYFEPRVTLFALLNQLVQHQEVDERMLFGYLADDFNKFVEIGVTKFGQAEFRKQFGPRLSLLLQVWGTHIKSSHLLHNTSSVAI